MGHLRNDLALLKLDRPAVLRKHIKTICLPNQDDQIKTGTKCFITGK